MLQTTLHLTESTDVDAAVADLRTKCERAALGPVPTELLIAQTKEIVGSLVERGKQLAAIGSQMQVTRDINGDDYAVKIIFGAGVRRGFLQRVIDAVRGG